MKTLKISDELLGYASVIASTVREPLVILDEDLKILIASPSFCSFFSAVPREIIGKLIYDFENNQWDILKLRELLEVVLTKQKSVVDFVLGHDLNAIGRSRVLLNAQCIEQNEKKLFVIALVVEGVIAQADTLVLMNTDLSIQSMLKDKRADELFVANKEKQKIAGELVLANDEKNKNAKKLVLANEQKDKRTKELSVANKELVFKNKEIISYRSVIKNIVNFDPLTGLPNRALFLDRLNYVIEEQRHHNISFGVAYMDLDFFKNVNDAHGHDVGDKLLVEVSKRVKQVLREGDTLARVGGDGFMTVFNDSEENEVLLKKLLNAASETIIIGDIVVQVSASIGVVFYPDDGKNAGDLFRHADQAMYLAKQAGRNNYQMFDIAQEKAIKNKLHKIRDVRLALKRDEFVLHYQPKVNLRTFEVIGVEALIRWQHPVRGILAPFEFLPAIENQSVSLLVGEWVINRALTQIRQWQSSYEHLPISVNISAYQLQQDNFTARLTALLSAHAEVNPCSLELEILETSGLENLVKVCTTMTDCNKLGVKFSLDDFGTGYSSLTYLKRLPTYLIKIDQSFVRDMLVDPDDLAIIKGVVGLAEVFQRKVIAEGVETIEHGQALLELGCELVQGYGIARPMPASDVFKWISEWKTDNSWRV